MQEGWSMWLGMLLRRLRPGPRQLMARGTALCCALLASALIMLVWAGAGTGHVQVLREYAAYTVDMAAAVLGAGLIGGLLLEDMLLHTGGR